MGRQDQRPDEIAQILGEADELLEEGEAASALEAARRGARLAQRAADPEAAAEFALLEGIALSDLGAAAEAVRRLDDVLRARPGDVDAQLHRGLALFELCRFDEAREQLAEVLRSSPRDAWAHHCLGLIAERLGEPAEAARRFARACREAPEDFPQPVELSHEAFDRVVEDALASLPAPVRTYLSNVAITVEDHPTEEDLLASDPPLSPSILGLFRGSPLGEKASMDPWSHFPSSIVLYQKNLQRFARDRPELIKEIGVTLVHEVGHFLGLDEEDLWERGLD